MRKESWKQLDILRGISVFTMIFTHVWISFFSSSSSQIGSFFSLVGGYISFPIFLFVSGLLIGLKWTRLSIVSLLRKFLAIFLIYIVIGVVYAMSRGQDFISVFSSPIYLQEYLIPLALFPLIGYVIRRIVDRFDDHVNETWITARLGYTSIFLFVVFLLIAFPMFDVNNVFSIFVNVSNSTWNTFPLQSYGFLFFMAVWLGYLKSKDDKYFKSNLLIILGLSTLVSILLYIAKPVNIFQIDTYRFPPLPFYLTSSLSITLGLYLLTDYLAQMKSSIFEFVGKFALHFFVAHLLLIHLGVYVVNSDIFKKEEPVLVVPKEKYVIFDEKWKEGEAREWKFEGSKSTEILITDSTKTVFNVYVDSSKIKSNAFGYDMKVYGMKDGIFSSISYRNYLDINTGYWIQIDNIGYSSIYFSILDAYIQPTNEILLNQIESIKDKKLKADYTLNQQSIWEYKPLTVVSKKNVLIGEDNLKKISQTIHLPVTCLELEALNEQYVVKLEYNSTKLEYKCVDDYITTTVDMSKKYSIGDNKIVTTLSIYDSNDLLKAGYSFTKDFSISYPTYVLWSLDWEAYYVPTENLTRLTTIRTSTQGLVFTHMFNPRIWNTLNVAKSNQNMQISYVKNANTKYKDEIAMHLHMYKDMLVKAGVTPLEINGWSGSKDGYDVPFTQYKYEDQLKMCLWAKNQFKIIGLPDPITFRAGGWFINHDGLRAIKDCGMKIDTSARTKYNTLNFGAINKFDGFWDISAKAQPYWISNSSQNLSSTIANSVGIYEIPNTGADTWAFSTTQLIGKFNGIYYMGNDKQSAITFISHPDYFKQEQLKMAPTLRYVDYFSNHSDNGSVIYSTLTSYYNKYAGVK